jgi:hypothetical protein
MVLRFKFWMKSWMIFAIILIAASAHPIWAIAQNDSKNSASTSVSCKADKALVASDFYGTWVLVLRSGEGAAQTAQLLLKQNPEFAESLAGEFILNGQRIEVFGDIEEGVLELEESANGKDISALWKGRLAEGGCGQAITGTRRILAIQTEQSFVLRRAGW